MSESLSAGDVSSSLAARNPTRDVIPARLRPRPKTTNAEKITAEARRQMNRENAAAFHAEIQEIMVARDSEVSRIATKYSKKEVYIKHILNNDTNLHGMRAPSLRNALVHAKGVEMNEGKSIDGFIQPDFIICPDREKGDRLTLKEIQKLVDDDTSLKNLSDVQIQEFIAELQAHRDIKKTGVRASNKAAALDCRGTIDRISCEVRTLLVCHLVRLYCFLFIDEELVGTNWCMRDRFFHPLEH